MGIQILKLGIITDTVLDDVLLLDGKIQSLFNISLKSSERKPK